ncbi:alpha,alpha-trehalose-phosphate synthase (UDP-forming) [Desertibaculum subflavum]|uniref:alpha,alpha-trehalose-phosphate synthase (UDP-forming) n=1 Tax=Desertibaculum subflavum TaxID=2268458 RepID=UPI000E661815
MARLVIVSNRVALPRERGARAGGLAVALREALAKHGGLWFGWSGETSAEASDTPRVLRTPQGAYATLDLSEAEHAGFYVGFANSTLWPLFHYRLGLIDFRRAAFEAYLGVNRRFAAALAPMVEPDDLVWVHDYHFIPMATKLRKLGLRNRIGFFLHIPFPAKEVLTALPGHERLVADLCAYDLVGFQTQGDVEAFQGYIASEAGGRVGDGWVEAFGRRLRVGAFPIGIDAEAFAEAAVKAAASEETQRLKDSLAGRRLMIGVDRLDHSKGLPKRFEAFQELLGTHPEHRGKVTFMQIAPISRGEVAQYRTLRRELEGLAGRINGKYAEFDWAPVRYLNRAFVRTTLAGFYRFACVGLVTPLRDGMNLVAKEYVAAQDPADPGVLILSRFAGAARELDGALIVNPFDIDQLAAAMHRALRMPLDERRARWSGMMDIVRRHDITHWRETFMAALIAAPPVSSAAAA